MSPFETKEGLKLRALLAFECHCGHCNRRGTFLRDPDGQRWHLDRIWPGHEGGLYEADNVVLACRDCNLRKGNKIEARWDSVAPLAFMEHCQKFCWVSL